MLDEADRMLDMGFEKQVRTILDTIRPDRQTLLFSATFRKRVEGLAKDAVRNPVRITVGTVGQSSENIQQKVTKLRWGELIGLGGDSLVALSEHLLSTDSH